MRPSIALACLLAIAAPAAALAGKKSKAPEPEHVVVQHVLVSFEGRLAEKKIARSQMGARALAHEILGKAKAGEDFGALVKEHTDDQYPGIYKLANKGVAKEPGEYERGEMVPAFGDVAFSLAVGEVRLAEYEPQRSPFGFHVIKRIE